LVKLFLDPSGSFILTVSRGLSSANRCRVTNAFSKKIENHAAMVAIHAVHYNFARIHKTLRITPSMAAGLSDHVWSLEEIVLLDNFAPKMVQG
jgi:hypothetical protein